MQKIFRNTYAKVSLQNLRHNLRTLKTLSGESTYFCPMVKANAYGHGAVQVAQAARDEGASALGVALVEEGIELREKGIEDIDILVFHPNLDLTSAMAILEYNLIPVVSSWPSLLNLQKCAGTRKVAVHIKLNTGMNRLGFGLNEIELICGFLRTQSILQLKGICTHLLNGEDWGIEGSYTEAQLYAFSQALKLFKDFSDIQVHGLNSGGVIAGHCAQKIKSWNYGVRPGISIYGVKPTLLNKSQRAQDLWGAIDLKPVMSVHSEIALLQKANQGEVVSYNGDFKCERDSLIGVMPIGYADGFRRSFSNSAHVLCMGQKVPVVGRVCMDSTMVDLTECKKMEKDWLGQEVLIIGQQGDQQITAEDLAALGKTNSYEIFTGFNGRLKRIYI